MKMDGYESKVEQRLLNFIFGGGIIFASVLWIVGLWRWIYA